jgi:hypothetical protein
VVLKLNGTHQLLAHAADVPSHHQNVDQNWDIKVANRSFENVLQLKYLENTVNKSKSDSMLATIRSRTSCVLGCRQKT